MKTTIITVIFILSLIGNAFCQKTVNLKLYSPKEIQDDLDTLAKYIEETHLNAFYKFSKIDFYKELNLIKSKIIKPTSSIDLYFFVSPLIAKIEDGHTSLEFPYRDYLKSNPYRFPYIVKYSNNEPYLIIENSYESIENELSLNAEIISVNNIDTKTIIQDINNLNSGESSDFRLARALGFSYYLTEFYKLGNEFSIKYKINNEIKNKTIKGIKNDSLNKMQKKDRKIEIKEIEDFSLKILSGEKKTAIIDFVRFSEIDKFKGFADSAFKQIKANNVDNLIIDIRENGGGNSALGDELFQYISHKKFTQYAKSKTKYSKLRKEFYKEVFLELKDSIFLRNIDKPFGLIEEDSDTSLIQLRENPLRFNGQVYLLTSTSTFSSATDFAQCFKYYNMGKIIGQETGGWIVCYGDVISGILPKTKLLLNISHRLFYDIGAKENDWHGVIPDINMSSDKAMDYTLKLINKK